MSTLVTDNVMVPAVQEGLTKAIGKALTTTAKDPTTTVTEGASTPKAKAEVVAEVMREISKSPELKHATNQEPWYQSRVTWGIIIGGISTVAGFLGKTIAPEDQVALIQMCSFVGTGVGAFVSWWGRWMATKPLGA